MSIVDNLKQTKRSDQEDEIQVVEFIIGDDKFAINLFDVREIVEASKITPLPHASSYIRGIIDLRGEITTIIDLRQLLQIQAAQDLTTADLRFIVLDDTVSAQKTGIVVDEVTSVLTVPVTDIDQASRGSVEEGGYILGIIKKEIGEKGESKKELVIWIDIRELISQMD
ncbi:chemotaxis protein CheW [Methanospirillum sp. J.3.6.1-F.2.7.3]|jgi:purine-binding chemotaxis protein CheW|uniref:Chemotaxis protein CheW n=2 Tax=Methanospirillum TaxID=2202 RepID=A0A8E7EIP5_9EURY|nr:MULTISPECIES: chemotaxis protein CheW [Methanospirillum]MDX8551649.1 chemotaxis protein CheW [Methanospirillum hungatei]QVV90342.1 chemotaxis protein CheW [Methanospirillum sp. J.3.6.1-F.2.7.3]QXO94728.1 chemotaxis protein CheW [Methanospirillum hungatei]